MCAITGVQMAGVGVKHPLTLGCSSISTSLLLRGTRRRRHRDVPHDAWEVSRAACSTDANYALHIGLTHVARRQGTGVELFRACLGSLESVQMPRLMRWRACTPQHILSMGINGTYKPQHQRFKNDPLSTANRRGSWVEQAMNSILLSVSETAETSRRLCSPQWRGGSMAPSSPSPRMEWIALQTAFHVVLPGGVCV